MYMWMFCNHRSPRPCLHTFFIVFRRVPPHTFHTFLVNMISHPHGIPPPVLYTFVIFCYCHLSVILWNSSENLFSRFCQGVSTPPDAYIFKNVWNPPPLSFLVYTGWLYTYTYNPIYVYVCVRIIFRFTMIFWIYLYNTKMHLHMYIYIYVYTYSCAHTYVSNINIVWMYVCMFVCMFVCMYVCMSCM